MQEFKVHGLEQLKHTLDRLPDAVAKKVLRKAVFEGAKLVRDEAKALAPVQTGQLERSIIARIKRGTGRYEVIYEVGPSKQQGWYGMWVELGTSKTWAYPYLRPAFDRMARHAIRKFRYALRQGIEQEARKL